MTQPVELGLDYIQDPHAANQRLREQAAAVQVVMPSGMRAWLITRYPQARPHISAITAALLDDIAVGDEADPVESFAFPLPIMVICELLGLPVEDRDKFREWSDAVVSAVTRQAEIDDAAVAWSDYVSGLLEAKREDPADDLLSALVHVEDAGDRLSRDELLAMVFLLLAAGPAQRRPNAPARRDRGTPQVRLPVQSRDAAAHQRAGRHRGHGHPGR